MLTCIALIMRQNRRPAIPIGGDEVIVKAFDFDVVDGDAFGVRFVAGGGDGDEVAVGAGQFGAGG